MIPKRWIFHPGALTWHLKLHQMMLDVLVLLDKSVEVVIVRIPSTGIVGDLEREAYPRSEYWDVVEHICRNFGCRTIHFEVWPLLADFELVDGSHVEGERREEFTTAFCQVLELLRGEDEQFTADASGRESRRR